MNLVFFASASATQTVDCAAVYDSNQNMFTFTISSNKSPTTTKVSRIGFSSLVPWWFTAVEVIIKLNHLRLIE